MIILLSPAKTFNSEEILKSTPFEPTFKSQTGVLTRTLQKLDSEDLKNLMKVSDKIAKLNIDRYNHWETAKSFEALTAFGGTVYQALQAHTFSPQERQRAQAQIRILSGLYGLIEPLRGIRPYRLEMGTKLRVDSMNNLYEFWGNTITDALNQFTDTVVLNLASQEYSRVINQKELSNVWVDIEFLVQKDAAWKNIGIISKKMRGLLARYIIIKNAKKIEDLVSFSAEGFCFDAEYSTDTQLIFKKEV